MTTTYAEEPVSPRKNDKTESPTEGAQSTSSKDSMRMPNRPKPPGPDYREVNGWGADLDLKHRGVFPRELPSNVWNVRGEVDHWQQPEDKIHVSPEHPNLTPVFGTTLPPRGLSGTLRDYAYNYGEAANRHWLTLMLADRINVLERLFGDAARGRPDNYIKEKGWSAKLKYATPERRRQWMLIGGAAIGAVALGVILNQVLSSDED